MMIFWLCVGLEVFISFYATQVVNLLQHYGILDPTVNFDGGHAMGWTLVYGTLFIFLLRYIIKKCNF